MIILQIILLTIVAWLLLKLVVRFFVIYRSAKNFLNIAKGFQNNASKTNKNSFFYTFTKGYANQNATSDNNNTNNTKANNSNYDAQMVECEKCQLFIPIDESYYTNGKHFCCKEHSKD